MIYYIFYSLILLTTLLLWLLTYTYIHELTHYTIAKAIKPQDCLIILHTYKDKTNIIYKRNYLTIVKTPWLKHRGITLLKDNYCSYTTKQIKKIAIGPKITQIIYFAFFRFLTNLINTLLTDIFNPLFLLLDIFVLLYVVQFSLKDNKEKGWTDIKIFKNPQGYLEYAQNTLSEDEKYEYWKDKLLC